MAARLKVVLGLLILLALVGPACTQSEPTATPRPAPTQVPITQVPMATPRPIATPRPTATPPPAVGPTAAPPPTHTPGPTLPLQPFTIERVSVASDGTQATNLPFVSTFGSRKAVISSDGRFVAFWSDASNLVPEDTDDNTDGFVHDRETGQTERLGLAYGTMETNSRAVASISADGRFVPFTSNACTLFPGDTDCADFYNTDVGNTDVFVHDRKTGQTEQVSVASDGTQANSTTEQGGAAISADSRFVAFTSAAFNLVPEDTNKAYDVFVHDRETGVTERVSVASDGTQGNGRSAFPPAISADGRFVAFTSGASNLVPDDTNDTYDVFVHDRETGVTERVSVASNETQADEGIVPSSGGPSISGDGRFVAFLSAASDLVPEDTNDAGDVFVHDRQTGQTERVSVASDGTQGNSSSYGPSISFDGRFVAFTSGASNLVPEDTNDTFDVFVHDRQRGVTERVSVASDGTQGNGRSAFPPAISADGRFVAFTSGASNLVPDDTNGLADVFVASNPLFEEER